MQAYSKKKKKKLVAFLAIGGQITLPNDLSFHWILWIISCSNVTAYLAFNAWTTWKGRADHSFEAAQVSKRQPGSKEVAFPSPPHHGTAAQLRRQSEKGMVLECSTAFAGLRTASTLVGGNSGKDSGWLIKRIGTYLPVITKLIAISTFLPNALLLMNGHDLGEKMIMALGILSLQIACNTVCPAEAAPLQEKLEQKDIKTIKGWENECCSQSPGAQTVWVIMKNSSREFPHNK